MATLTRVFPALAKLRPEGDKVALVNGGIVEEVLLPIGAWTSARAARQVRRLAVADARRAQVAGRRIRFSGEVRDRESVAAKQKKRCADFYIALQRPSRTGSRSA